MLTTYKQPFFGGGYFLSEPFYQFIQPCLLAPYKTFEASSLQSRPQLNEFIWATSTGLPSNMHMLFQEHSSSIMQTHKHSSAQKSLKSSGRQQQQQDEEAAVTRWGCFTLLSEGGGGPGKRVITTRQ